MSDFQRGGVETSQFNVLRAGQFQTLKPLRLQSQRSGLFSEQSSRLAPPVLKVAQQSRLFSVQKAAQVQRSQTVQKARLVQRTQTPVLSPNFFPTPLLPPGVPNPPRFNFKIGGSREFSFRTRVKPARKFEFTPDFAALALGTRSRKQRTKGSFLEFDARLIPAGNGRRRALTI